MYGRGTYPGAGSAGVPAAPCACSTPIPASTSPGNAAATAELSERAPSCRVIVHSGYDDQSRVDEAVAAGAWGFVSKHGDPQTLFAAIRRVHAGEVVIATGLAHAS